MNRDSNVGQIDQLTGLRAFLALWVVTRHLFFPFENGAFIDFGTRFAVFDHGYLGVDGFFILSGFILAYNYANGRPLDYRAFIGARFARIYPVHFVTLLGAIGLVFIRQFVFHKHLIGTAQNTYPALAANVVLLNAWSFKFVTGWNDVAWSVSAEWFAYVFFPLFVALAPARNRLVAGALLLVPAGALALLEWRSDTALSLPGGLARLIPEFYAGVLLCRLRRGSGFAPLPRVLGLAAIGVIALGVFLERDTVTVAGLALLIFALSSHADFLAPILALRPIVYLGEISYCLYMVQRFPMEGLSLARKASGALAGSPLMQLIVLLAMLLVVSHWTHRLIELPGRKWLRRALSAQHVQPQASRPPATAGLVRE
ncbi:acyltransferase family protein [Trinickia diaoshuihuensis]|jgi:peptidoglycan/LPS O-acetylase OafA/YrhL|uniref:acyltransferase family protein n=1 Tax=Trinickia diaoshuihuensis TaxID=2292265 RepID=UPI000E274064|nr:acyltransferase [Trinickia diaoshuihuensis]